MKPIGWFVAFVCLSASVALAQNAQLSGVVKDKTGAVVPQAEVTLMDVDTASTLQTRTSRVGFFVFPSVQPGKYDLSAASKGFDETVIYGLRITTAANISQDLILHIKRGAETFTVVQKPDLNTTDGTVSTVIEHEFIDNMPLNGKDLTTLFELTPGTLLNAGGTPSAGGGFSVDGQRPTANYVTVDGASANAYIPTTSSGSNFTGAGIATSASGGTNGILPVDAIEEYRMDTSTYTAENGRSPGGQIQVRTRSGTNQFHGTLFEDFRNQVLDANDWFSNYDKLAQTPLRMNEFGGTADGPVIIPHLLDGKNKLFFFVANDNLLFDQPNTVSKGEVPDASLLQGAYSPFKNWLEAFPLGNGGLVPGFSSFDYYNYSYPNIIRDYTTSARVDVQLPKSAKVFFRANVAPSSSDRLLAPAEAEGSQVSVNTFTGGLTLPLGNQMVDELTANYTSDNTKFRDYTPSIGGNSPSALNDNLPNGVSSSIDNFTFEPLVISGRSVAVAAAFANGVGERNKLHQWNLVDTFSLHRGRHTLKFGADLLSRRIILLSYLNSYTVEPYAAASPPYTDTSLDTGVITDLRTTSNLSNPNVSLSNTSLFVNDDWKMTSSLTLNAGIRWELDPAARIGPLGAFAFVGDNTDPATFQAALTTNPLYQTVYNNIAPRIGFAWKPKFNGGTIIRGGAGIYFDTGQAASAADQVDGGYPYSFSQSLSSVSYGSFNWASPGGSQENLGIQQQLYLSDPQLVSPRTYEWSLTLDQRLGAHTKLTASYVGNDGEKLIGEREYYNSENSAGKYPVNTNYVSEGGDLYIVTNQSHSNYQSLQMQLTSRVAQRLIALVSYTWEHAEDNGSTDFSELGAAVINPMANSAYDIPQMFAGALHYAPEGIRGNSLLKALTGGWEIDTIARLQSGSPITVTFESPFTSINQYTSNADVIAGVPTVLREHVDSFGNVVPGNRLLNWAAFTSPPLDASGNQLRNGNSPTNGYRLFGLKDWDLSASRTLKLYRDLNLMFRVDAYNILNTPNFASVANTWTSGNASSFGRSEATYANTYGETSSDAGTSGAQLNAFQNGGPRELQLSLKLKF